MIPPEARGVWRDVEARLRPYVARRVGCAADVDDVLQEILVKVHGGMDGLRDAERFGGWVYRIAGHVIADFAKARARAPIASGAVGEPPDERDVAGEEAAGLQADLGECVALFLARLPAPYRGAVTLTDLQGLTQKEAAEMLGISLSGMKSRVQRGRERIRQMFEECCEISLDCRGQVVECASRPLQDVPEDCRGAAVSWTARQGRTG
jgi:RNA polymerase sigma-70 factor (ECF subfamily)